MNPQVGVYAAAPRDATWHTFLDECGSLHLNFKSSGSDVYKRLIKS